MPSTTCPACGIAVKYLNDLVGVLQCPGCGEELLHGKEEPSRRDDAPTPHYRDADLDHVPTRPARPLEDDPEEEDTRVSQRANFPPERRPWDDDEDDDRPPRAVRPAGVEGAGRWWIRAGVVGLLANAVLLFFAMPSAGARLPGDGLLILVLLVVGTLLYYAGLIRVGVGLRSGSQAQIQLPAGFALLVALIWLGYNGTTALSMFFVLDQFAERGGFQAGGGMTLFFYGWMIPHAVLTVVGVVVILASVVLLWQSARYVHWQRGGEALGGTAPGSGGGFPAVITTAGLLWLAVTAASVGLDWYARTAISPLPDRSGLPSDVRTWADVFVAWDYSYAAAVPLLTTGLLALLLFAARLPSTALAGVAFLLGCLLAIFYGVYVLNRWYAYLPAGMKFPHPKDAWLIYARFGIHGVGVVAALLCIAGSAAYRRWLRRARGLDV